jgi:F-type H+-transporting ATPase subunit epsilon
MSEATKVMLKVEIADVSRLVYEGHSQYIVAPAAMGQVCIYPRHTPFLSSLIPGEVRVLTERNEILLFYVSGGFMEVKNSAVTVLADEMLRSEEIDREVALQAKQQAEMAMKSTLFSERDRAKLDLVKALAQLRVLEDLEISKIYKSHKGRN